MKINENGRQPHTLDVRCLLCINPQEKIVPSSIDEYLPRPGSKVAEENK